MRSLKATGTKMVLVLFLSLAANTILSDRIGDGILFSETRLCHALTLLRSPVGQDRANAVHEAILLIGNKRIEAALGQIMETPGEAREWAAYAAGIRHDRNLADSILALLNTGNPRERAAAAIALARLGDLRLIHAVPKAYQHAKDFHRDLLKALGMLGKRASMTKADLKTAGDFLASLLNRTELDEKETQIAVWALGRFDAPEGLEPIMKLVQSPLDLTTQCIGIEALGRIGAADSSPQLIQLVHRVDKEASCNETAWSDFAGDEILLCSNANLVERILYEIARIGDRRASSEMQKLAKDRSFSKTARALARKIALRMGHK